jgi:hypothetical protein
VLEILGTLAIYDLATRSGRTASDTFSHTSHHMFASWFTRGVTWDGISTLSSQKQCGGKNQRDLHDTNDIDVLLMNMDNQSRLDVIIRRS